MADPAIFQQIFLDNISDHLNKIGGKDFAGIHIKIKLRFGLDANIFGA
jgi:hypothetical protein